MIDRRTLLHGGAMLSLAACNAPQDATRLRIGFQRNGVLFIARTRGEIDRRLRSAGYSLDWVEFPSGPPLIEAMNAGAVDFGAVGDTPAVYAQAAGVPIKLVAAQVYLGQTAGNAFLTLPTRRLPNVAALKGRKIGFTKGSSAEVAALSALDDAGLAIGDVTPVTLAPGDGVAALGAGEYRRPVHLGSLFHHRARPAEGSRDAFRPRGSAYGHPFSCARFCDRCTGRLAPFPR